MAKRKIGERLANLPSKALDAGEPHPGEGKPKRPARRSRYMFGVISARGLDSVRCVVLNSGAGGMKVSLEGAFALPSIIRISVPAAGIACDAELIWQSGREAGLVLRR